MSVRCDRLSFAYEKKSIIKEISLEVERGRITGIAGPNGAGKSTLLKCLCNIYEPDEGVIYLNGREIACLEGRELAKSLGYVPQEQGGSFSMTVYEMILLGRRPYIKWKVRNQDEAVVESTLERLNINDLAERDVSTLSGGEKQKVAIARALAQEPEALFLDEPTSSLDINHQLEVMELLAELADRDQTAVVTVLHDLNLASNYSGWVYLISQERIVAAGRPSEVFTPENIKRVYGIDVEIVEGSGGTHIIPVKSRRSSYQSA